MLDRYFTTDDTDEYVLFEVLKADSLAVVPRNEKGAGVSVDVPAIQGAVGATVEVASGTASSSEVVFKGREPITFGFKCFRIAFIDGKWSITGAKPSANLAFAAAENAAEAVLIGRGQLSLR